MEGQFLPEYTYISNYDQNAECMLYSTSWLSEKLLLFYIGHMYYTRVVNALSGYTAGAQNDRRDPAATVNLCKFNGHVCIKVWVYINVSDAYNGHA